MIFIRNGFIEKCMADKRFGIYVFSWGKRDSLYGFMRGLLGFYRATREGFLVLLGNEILSKKNVGRTVY